MVRCKQIEFLVSHCKRSDEILKEAKRVFNMISCRMDSQFALNKECERMVGMIKEHKNEKEFWDGLEIKVHKEKWTALKYFGYGLFLAVKPDDDFPKQTYLVREDNEGG